MKRIFKLWAVIPLWVIVLFGFSWAQCPQEPIDMGICDTLYVEPWAHTDTCFDGICINQPGQQFPCFLFISLFVTHDSNSFYWPGGGRWVQDSISTFVVPLNFWHDNVGGKVIFPTTGSPPLNNTKMDPSHAWFPKSVFRHIVVDGDTIHNRLAQMVGDPDYLTAWTVSRDVDTLSGPTDSGHVHMGLIPASPECRRWWEGSKELLATYTFKVTDSMHVCFDSTFWPPGNNLSFTRYDAVNYVPRDNLPLCTWVGPPPQPSVAVTAPNGGEQWCVDSTYHITWTSSGIDNVKIEYSTDGGSTWITIIASTPAALGTYAWTLPNTPSITSKVKICDAADNDPCDESNDVFTIKVCEEECINPVHFVFKDNTGDSYSIAIDSAFLDCLQLQECDEVGVFDDTGGGLLCVGASVYHPADLPIPLTAWKDDPLTPQKDGYTAGHTMHFKVWSSSQNREDTATAHYIVGNGTFEFGFFSKLWLEHCVQQTITVTSPNGGENWCGGSAQNITWTSANIDTVKIEWSTDGGSSWVQVVDKTPAVPGSYSWTVPNAPFANIYLVKICDAKDGTPCDQSDAVFTISAPPSAPTNCVASDDLYDKVHFCWTDNSTNENGFRIYRNDTLIDSVGADVTCYDDFSGTPGQTYNYCAKAYNICGESDQCCDNGTRLVAQAVAVTAPNGGEQWCVDSTYNITWTSSGIDNVKLEYSTDGGSTWTTIIASTPAAPGTYAWTVPNTSSGNSKVKICDAADNDPCDESNNVFTIKVCEEECINPVHFVFKDSTEDSYSIVIDSALLDCLQMKECDEVGVFDDTGGGLLCVGASVYHPADLPIPLIAWKDDPLTDQKDGYTAGHTMHFKVWSSSQNREETPTAHYIVGNGTFEFGFFSKLWLEFCPQEIITVTSPNGGEHWCVDSTYNITWTSSGIDSVMIMYIIPLGDTTFIAKVPAVTGTYAWTVPNTPSTSCRVIICDASDFDPCDESNEVFTIKVCEEECINPVHFVFKDSTEDSYSIVIDSAFLDALQLEECDEVGVFDDTGGGLLCVGASVYHPANLPIPLIAWKDDPLTPQKDGYTAGDTMYFRVWSKNQNREECATSHLIVGNGHFESGFFSKLWLEAPCCARPAPPTNCQASDDLCDQVHFCWQDNSNNEEGFKIYRNGTLLATVDPNVTCYDDFSGTPGQTYSYCVKAYNVCGESDPCCDEGIRPAPPTPPTNCVSSDDLCDKVHFCWTDNSNNEDGFKIYRNGTLLATVDPNITCYDDFTADPGVTYEYCVKAFNICGESDPCCDEGIRLAPPCAPSNCVASDDLCDKVHFCWQDNCTNEDGFRIYRNDTLIDSVGADVTCYDDFSGTPGQTYNYCVKAYNICGESDQCCDEGTSPVPTIMVTTPNGGENWCVGSTHDIRWTCSCVESVKIEYTTNGGTNWIFIATGVSCGTGSYSWTVPNTPSDNCLVKVSDASDGDPFDVSDALFTISPPCTATAHIPDTCVYQGLEACIPVYLDALPPWEVSSSQMVLLYDESVLHATYAKTEGGIAESWGTPTYNIGAGWISLAMAGTEPLTTTGVLVWVCFDVVGQVGDNTLLAFENGQIVLNDSFFVGKAGLIQVCGEAYEICGRVRYCLNDQPVKDAQMMISVGKNDTVYTDVNGFYKFTHLPGGLDYLVRGDKTDDARGAISAFDASLVLRYAVGLLNLSACKMIAGDVNGNCWVNAYDASFILRYVVGLINQFPVGKDWKLIPADFPLDTLNWCHAPDSAWYEDLSEDLCCEDWKGILYGDLSGNWNDFFFVGGDRPEDVLSRLIVKDIQVNPGEEFVVPIEVEDLAEVYGAELSLTYDNSLLNLVKVVPAELLQGYYFEKNLTSGEIRLAMAGTSPIQGSGNLVNLTFKVLPQAQEGITTQLQVSHFCLNEVSSGGSAFNISIGSGSATHPTGFSLFQNYPNPFNPETEIGFVVPTACKVQIRIYNVGGQLVKIYEGEYPAGTHSISWDGTNLKGEEVRSGIYFYRMDAGNFAQQKKMVLMR